MIATDGCLIASARTVNVDPASELVKEPDRLWAGVSESADDRRLKRLARKGVWVRIPPPAFRSFKELLLCHV